ncbi:MAG: hypothetical protein LBG96_04670 [Tannerella sp.]|jgi:hypothetical protein|nr:hypothetical protein [Tannerella sp.]
MKKLVFFIVIAFVSQMLQFVYGQNYRILGNPIEFGINSDFIGLQMRLVNANDYALYFPISTSSNNKWNRIIAKNQIAFFTGDRGLNDTDQPDVIITTQGNVGIGCMTPSEKLIVGGNLRLENNGKIMSNDELEFTGNIFSLNAGGVKGLQFKKGFNNDFTLFFPVSDATNSRWNRIIAANNLSFTAGNRGTTKNETDLFIHTSGNVGIGTTSPSEKLTVSGNLKLDNGKVIINNKGELRINSFNEMETYGDSLSFNIKGTKGLQMKLGRNNDFTMFFPISNGGGRLNRIIAKDNLSISAGGRSMNDENTDLHLHSSGNMGIGTYVNANSEKLTLKGNLKLDNGKLFININPNNIKAILKNKYSAFITGGVLSEDYAIGPQSTWADHVFKPGYNLQSLNEIEDYIKVNNHLPDMPSATEVQENGYTLHDMNVKLLQKVEELTLYSIEQNKKIERLESVVKSYKTLMEKVNQLESRINP